MEVNPLQKPSNLSIGDFDRLNDDVLSHIVKACDLTSVLRLRRVCKAIKAVFESIPRFQLKHLETLGIDIELDRNKPLCLDSIAKVAAMVKNSELEIKELDHRLQARLVQHVLKNNDKYDVLMLQLSRSRFYDVRIAAACLKNFPPHICYTMSQHDKDPRVRRALKSHLKRHETMASFQLHSF